MRKILADQLVYCQTSPSWTFKQVSEYFESSFFSKYQCGFRKGFSAQDCLLSMLEKWNSATDNKKAFGALLTDLLKAFDCLSHDLLIDSIHVQN